MKRTSSRQSSQSSKDSSPRLIKTKDAKGVAEYLTSGRCKNVFFMVGAGLSTSAGIPDFRSPKAGLYANLARLNLPHPEAVFDIGFFKHNPVPFYTLAQELYPGKFRPTLSHAFITLLSSPLPPNPTHPSQPTDRPLLNTCFTQNIDTLERRAGVPGWKIIEAHGSFATSRCIECKGEYDGDKMREKVRKCEVPRCERKGCEGLVKPDIVFFGEALPESFISAIPSLSSADLLIIIGTSLTVHPFASLTGMVPRSCPRVLINLDQVGGIGTRPEDVVLLGKCDEIVREICREAGWEAELVKIWEGTKGVVEDDGDHDVGGERKGAEEEEKGELDEAEKEVERLAERVGRELALGGADVSEKIGKRQEEAQQEAKEDGPGISKTKAKEPIIATDVEKSSTGSGKSREARPESESIPIGSQPAREQPNKEEAGNESGKL